MKIGILSQWYDPEPGPAALPGILARELVNRGHDVHVLTGFPNYPTGHLAEGYRLRFRMEESIDGVNVTRTFLIPQHNKSGLGRVINYVSFGVSAALLGNRALRNVDVLWVNYSPITVTLPIFSPRFRKVPIITEVADLWPDTMLVSGLTGSRVLSAISRRFLTAWTSLVYQVSTYVVHIAPGVRNVLLERQVPKAKLQFIPKPADEKLFHPDGLSQRNVLGFDESNVVMLYAGSMGSAQSLDSLIEAVCTIGDPTLRLIMIGSGTEEERLRARAKDDSRIVFLGRRPMERMADYLATSDIAFIGLADHPLSNVTMPSKTQTIFASGRPALVAASGDVVDFITGADAGYVAEAGNVESIAEAIQKLLRAGRGELEAKGKNARQAYENQFSIKVTSDTIEKLLQTACKVPEGNGSNLQLSDIDVLVDLHLRAFPDFFLSKLGPDFLSQFYQGFINNNESVIAVERDARGRVIAVAVGSKNPRNFFRQLLRKRWLGFAVASIKYVVRHPSVSLRLARAIFYRGDSPTHGDGALLSSICVDPEYQGKGLGKEVLTQWLYTASSQGAKAAYLTTDAQENADVRAFYERQGWSTDHLYVTPEGRRMIRYCIDLKKVYSDQDIEAGN